MDAPNKSGMAMDVSELMTKVGAVVWPPAATSKDVEPRYQKVGFQDVDLLWRDHRPEKAATMGHRLDSKLCGPEQHMHCGVQELGVLLFLEIVTNGGGLLHEGGGGVVPQHHRVA